MNTNGVKGITVWAACTAAIALVSACSMSVGTPSLSADEVEQQATRSLAEAQGIAPEDMPPLDCPSDLPAEVGASIVCVIGDSTQGNTYDVTITVESVDGDNVGFDISVADQPRS